MHSPGSAIVWQLWQPHRWIIAAGGAYLSAAALLSRMLPSDIALAVGDTQVPAAGYVLGMTCLWVPLYLVAMFTWTSLPVEESGYPSWMLVLPVRVAALVAWPMFIGWLAMALVCLVIGGLVFRPAGIFVPLWWPAAAAATFLAIAQAASWLPVAILWLRMVVMLVTVLVLAGIGWLAYLADVPDPVIAGSLVAMMPPLFGVALYGVSRARRGESIELHLWRRLVEGANAWRAPRSRPFPSAAAAQLWREWRRCGLVLPAYVGLMLLTTVVPVLLLQSSGSRTLWKLLPIALLLPPFVAGILSGSLGREDLWSGHALSPFAATRPLSDASYIRCKMVMAAQSTLVTWALVLAVLAWPLLCLGFAEAFVRAAPGVPTWKLVVHAILIVTALIALTWLQLVKNLWIGLSGRAWVTYVVYSGLGILVVVGFVVGTWIYLHVELLDRLRPGALRLLPVLVLPKLAVATWVLRASSRRRLITLWQAAGMIGTWCIVVAGLSLAAVWWLPRYAVPLTGVVAGIAVFVPFSRMAAAPLALYWNRHR